MRIPPGQKATKKFPILHDGEVPNYDLTKWTFRVYGMVEEEKVLDYEEFMALPRVRIVSDIHCVTKWTRLDNQWEGVSSRVIKDIVRVDDGAKFVMIHGFAGFTANLSLEDFLADDVLFAIKHNGKELTPEHGYPLRLVVPRLYFWKSAKWAEGVEFTREDKPGYWEQRDYHMRGDPWKEERFGDSKFQRLYPEDT